MTEKAILRKMFLGVVLMVGFFLISLLVMQACFDQTYEAECRYLTEYHQQLGVDFDSSAYTYEVDETDLIRVKEIKEKNHRIICVVEPTGAKQSGLVEIRVRMANAAEALDNVWIKVDAHGRITDTETFNIPHYRAYQLAVILLLVGLCVLLWGGAVVSYRKLRYSYHTIYCIGLGIWMTVMSVTMIVYYAGEVNMLNTYQALVDAATRFSVITFPFVALFAIALTISNISLIRHEGFRTNNALGILLSGMMIVAFFAILLFSGLFSSGPTLTVTIWSAITESLQIIYVVLECFLIGAIVLGTISAKHTPSYDRDYLVILGCKIRKDGTLYPLIRGRVDRAIRFSREQEAATGKKAVFIPSGGQGNDEVISEAEAMQRYLLEQGIEESRILVEKKSKNTRENMLFSKELMKEGSKAAFSTTNFHVFRSGIISRQVGMDIDGMGSPTKWYFWPNAYIREVIGMLSYKWKSLAFMMVVITILLTALRFRFTI